MHHVEASNVINVPKCNKGPKCNKNLVLNVIKGPKCTYIYHTSFSGAPRGAFQQPVYNKCNVPWLRVLARPLQAVHNVFLSETLGCVLS